MHNLSKGQKIKINSKLYLEFDLFFDVSCFCLNLEEKLFNDDYMIFYNQPISPDGSIELQKSENKQKFILDLEKCDKNIKKLSFVITFDDKKIKDLQKELSCVSSDFSFKIPSESFNNEKAVMFCEIYLKDNQWRFNAYAQGFDNGLEDVVLHYGAITSSNQDFTSPVPNVSISKISLTKESSTTKLSLSKDIDNNNLIEISAIWYDNGDKNIDNDDLDLRVGLLLPDGRMTLIHGDKDVGSLDKKPFVKHSGDVKVVQNSFGLEKIYINPNISKLFGGKIAIVVSVYSALDNGVVSVASLKPKMEIKTTNHHISCEFNSSISSNPLIYTYVIGMLVIDNDNLIAKQLGTLSKPMSEATPWLTWNKNSEFPDVNIVGPSHFKGEPISEDIATISGSFFSKNKIKAQYVEHKNL